MGELCPSKVALRARCFGLQMELGKFPYLDTLKGPFTMMICRECVSTRFRCAHFHLIDVLWLLAFGLPVRCRDCGHRAHTNVFQALSIRRDDRIRRSWGQHSNA